MVLFNGAIYLSVLLSERHYLISSSTAPVYQIKLNRIYYSRTTVVTNTATEAHECDMMHTL